MAKALFGIVYSGGGFIDSLANIYEHHLSNHAKANIGTAKKKIRLLKESPSLFSKAESKKYPDCRKVVIEEYVTLRMPNVRQLLSCFYFCYWKNAAE